MRELRLFSKIARGLTRDQHLGVGGTLLKGVKLMTETMRARVALRSCDVVGAGARVGGRIRVDNGGSLSIGNGLTVSSAFLLTCH